MLAAVAASRWEKTGLWKELKTRKDPSTGALKTFAKTVLPKIEKVLASGGTAPTDFTLHDAAHSHRVAERIADLIGPELMSELSSHDLTLLLLGAYLHDIGMTPELSKLDALMDFLLSGDTSKLSDDDQVRMQAWLDDEWDGLVPPLTIGPSDIDRLRLSRRIVAGYVRHRHNDWSADWIANNLNSLPEPYTGFLADLARLCKSHHFNVDQLRDRAFSPKLIGTTESVLHLRYCACLLRVADVLEFDPERTPEILFAHRNVSDESAIFWHKDHQLGFSLKDGRISIQASPPDAVTHRAIELTIRDVDRELQVCRQLDDETHFNQMVGRDDLPHRWTLETRVIQDVKPLDGAYEYIDGTFRPDPKKLLELVGGVELYGSPLAAVRELLQNAFDAVREQIARQRLRQDDPADPAVQDGLARTHTVSLVLREIDGRMRLSCKDTGCGMSRDIIRSRFLVGGKKANHEMRALERACEAKGFTVGRTARFGIGVLSYFLIASKMTAMTRRAIEAGDQDATGWSFATDGLEDFGELKPAPQSQVGTEIELILKPNVVGEDPVEFAEELRTYIAEAVRRVPCRFTFSAPDLPVSDLVGDLGWLNQNQALAEAFSPTEKLGYNSSDVPSELLSEQARETRRETSEYWDSFCENAREALKVETCEGTLPDGLGFFRLHLGHFEINGYELTPYVTFGEDDENGLPSIEVVRSAIGFSSPCSLWMSWNGMRVEVEDSDYEFQRLFGTTNMVVEIDWCSDSAGKIAVDRSKFEPSDAANKAVEFAWDIVREQIDGFLARTADSPFSLLNARTHGTALRPATEPLWPSARGNPSSLPLTRLQPPLIDTGRSTDHTGLCWRGAPVNMFASQTLWKDQFPHQISWHEGGRVHPSSIGLMNSRRGIRIFPIWEELSLDGNSSTLDWLGSRASFPPEFGSVVSAHIFSTGIGASMYIWNVDHPLIAACDKAGMAWVTDTLDQVNDPLPFHKEMMESPARVAAWMLTAIRFSSSELWEGLKDRSNMFLEEAWGSIPGLEKSDELLLLREESARPLSLVVITPAGWDTVSTGDDGDWFEGRIALPGDDWWLAYEDGSREARSNDY